MKKIIYLVLILAFTMSGSFAYASKNVFQFQINRYHTQRQSGQTLEVYVRYALKDSVDYSAFPDYLALRKTVLTYLEPTKELPTNTYWEIIAAKIGDDLAAHFPLSGVSVQLLVHGNETGEIYEPGFHGPIYTIGDVTPLGQIVTFAHKKEKHNK